MLNVLLLLLIAALWLALAVAPAIGAAREWWASRRRIDGDQLLREARTDSFGGQPVLLFDRRLTADEVAALRDAWMRNYIGCPRPEPMPPSPADAAPSRGQSRSEWEGDA